MYEISIKDEFAAAHRLRHYRGGGERIHGHNWKVELYVRAEEPDDVGLVIDFEELKATARKSLDPLEHVFLNELPPFQEVNPTAENIARYLYETLSQAINGRRLKVSRVTVWETDSCGATYYQE